MKEIRLKRQLLSPISTIGSLSFEGQYQCDILEDTCLNRDTNQDGKLQASEKIKKVTAIPAGRYEIKMQHSPTYKRLMPYLQDVPHYTGIMIHWGNRDKDTEGCLLTGKRRDKIPDFVGDSKVNFDKLIPKIHHACKVGRLFIEIEGGYTA